MTAIARFIPSPGARSFWMLAPTPDNVGVGSFGGQIAVAGPKIRCAVTYPGGVAGHGAYGGARTLGDVERRLRGHCDRMPY